MLPEHTNEAGNEIIVFACSMRMVELVLNDRGTKTVRPTSGPDKLTMDEIKELFRVLRARRAAAKVV